ncbi:MAG: Na+/H+ antiporter NhaA [Clostridia bacterium]|nr:Na+/H+ antiporter NhaA [Deltaproteobacteria bacterium]
MDSLPEHPSRSLEQRGRVGPLFGRFVRPIQRFFDHEAAGGVVLLVSATIALLAANSPFATTYEQLRSTVIAVGIADWAFRFDVAALVNDGLMTLFFFVVGLEIKRELVCGELRTLQRALLPAIAAAGGMIAPALVYFALNADGVGARGWGVPMATDIAFVIGCLSLLKGRVPRGLAVFVVALAIFDDIGGIVVIALRYGTGLHLPALGVAFAIAAVLTLLNRASVGHWVVYTAGGIALWLALQDSGIHATLAGIVLGMMVPARAKRPARRVLDDLREHIDSLGSELQGGEVAHIEERIEGLVPPLERFIRALHPLQVYVIMPLFALLNAGVDVRGVQLGDLAGPIPLGIMLGLIVGKQVGIFATTFLAVKLGIARLPTGSSWRSLHGVCVLAGIGFTVALFIAELAFAGHPEALGLAKVGILLGSAFSGVAGYGLLRTMPHVRSTPQ